jgi:predicted polyphosphate/ATP-dependent NAD kinase
MKHQLGLIVNPVAGMGGSVGLKGTDGLMYKRALKLGAKPVTPKKTHEVLSHIKKKGSIALLVAPGKMGERYIRACAIPFKVIGTVNADTSQEDTQKIGKETVKNGAELTEEDVLDIDENDFREGRLSSRLYGYLLVPRVKKLLQRGKKASNIGKSAVESKKEIAKYVVEKMNKTVLYLLGPQVITK